MCVFGKQGCFQKAKDKDKEKDKDNEKENHGCGGECGKHDA